MNRTQHNRIASYQRTQEELANSFTNMANELMATATNKRQYLAEKGEEWANTDKGQIITEELEVLDREAAALLFVSGKARALATYINDNITLGNGQ